MSTSMLITILEKCVYPSTNNPLNAFLEYFIDMSQTLKECDPHTSVVTSYSTFSLRYLFEITSYHMPSKFSNIHTTFIVRSCSSHQDPESPGTILGFPSLVLRNHVIFTLLSVGNNFEHFNIQIYMKE